MLTPKTHQIFKNRRFCAEKGYIMARRRTGLTLIRGIAYRACRAITFWTPAIQVLYGTNLVLMAALEAANVACSALVMAADEELTIDP